MMQVRLRVSLVYERYWARARSRAASVTVEGLVSRRPRRVTCIVAPEPDVTTMI